MAKRPKHKILDSAARDSDLDRLSGIEEAHPDRPVRPILRPTTLPGLQLLKGTSGKRCAIQSHRANLAGSIVDGQDRVSQPWPELTLMIVTRFDGNDDDSSRFGAMVGRRGVIALLICQ